jgi:hypothetical protein
MWEYRFVLLWILATIIYGVTMGKEWVKAKAYALMLQAKKLAKDGALANGAEQEVWVVNGLYIVLQKLKIPFVTKERLQPIVHKLYIKAIDLLDNGKVDNSIQ